VFQWKPEQKTWRSNWWFLLMRRKWFWRFWLLHKVRWHWEGIRGWHWGIESFELTENLSWVWRSSVKCSRLNWSSSRIIMPWKPLPFSLKEPPPNWLLQGLDPARFLTHIHLRTFIGFSHHSPLLNSHKFLEDSLKKAFQELNSDFFMVMNCTRVLRYVYCPKGLRLIGTYASLRLTQKKAKTAEIDPDNRSTFYLAPCTCNHFATSATISRVDKEENSWESHTSEIRNGQSPAIYSLFWLIAFITSKSNYAH
jgi:hypothetical protein